MTRLNRLLVWFGTRPRFFHPSRIVAAAQAFIAIEASSGIVLVTAAAIALFWVNSPLGESYLELWHSRVVFESGLISIEGDLRDFVNDGLMTIFFFVVGLEIKRELVHGELSTARRALLPAAAALGGMLVPALIFLALNGGKTGMSGWGIPMATDIAFALGLLSLLGRRVPFSVKVFLLALAIADDIGAIIVIAVFYTSYLDADALTVATLILLGIIALNRAGVRNIHVYSMAGVMLWLAVFESGIHATLTGVALGLLTPAAQFYGPGGFAAAGHSLVERFAVALDAGDSDAQHGMLGQIEDLTQGTEAPLERLERQLHPWVGYLIVPLFALANAGVQVSSELVSNALTSPVSQGVFLGLLLGKPLGIFAFTWFAVHLRLCDLPQGSSLSHILGVGLLGGIGFTVSLLITGLAFDDPLLVEEAKLGILVASTTASVLGFAFLRLADARTSAASR